VKIGNDLPLIEMLEKVEEMLISPDYKREDLDAVATVIMTKALGQYRFEKSMREKLELIVCLE
jgi:hypothetical protein